MTKHFWIIGTIIAVLTALVAASTTAPTSAQVTSTIRLTIDCKSDPERTIIYNNTPQVLNLEGWVLSSQYRPIAAVEPFVLTGTVQPRASYLFSTGTGAPAAQSQLIYDNVDPSEGARLRTPFGTFTVSCIVGSQEFPFNPSATPPPSSTVAATPTSTVVLTGNQLWLSSPPGVTGVSSTCPSAAEWLLLYWSGPTVQIEQAVTACVTADFYWQRQNDRWVGYSQASPLASDSWSVEQGAAAFVHGRP